MVLTKGKRFIKKVPPSGVSPVFKLTLPHSVVHTHMHHLIDAEFDIATSFSAPQTWHGRISPRRNKSRSEYTLQGWRLFAEALGVKAGDQVSFELMNRRRLVVQIIKTGDGRPLDATSSPIRTAPSSPIEAVVREDTERSSTPLQSLQTLPVEADSPWSNFTSACALAAAQESSHQTLYTSPSEKARQASIPAKPSMLDTFEQWQADIPTSVAGMSPDNSARVGHASTESFESASNFLMHLTGSGQDLYGELPVDDPIGGFLTESSLMSHADGERNRHDSGSDLEMQLFSLNSMLQNLQSEARTYQERAVKAESEVARMKVALNKLKQTADQQTRGMLRAGSGIEAAVRRLQGPELLASVNASGSEAALAIRSEVVQYNDMLKACIWRLLNINN